MSKVSSPTFSTLDTPPAILEGGEREFKIFPGVGRCFFNDLAIFQRDYLFMSKTLGKQSSGEGAGIEVHLVPLTGDAGFSGFVGGCSRGRNLDGPSVIVWRLRERSLWFLTRLCGVCWLVMWGGLAWGTRVCGWGAWKAGVGGG